MAPPISAPRCYTVPQLLGMLTLSKSAFFEFRRRGKLPFLVELRPRIGRCPRYRADLVDRYLAGEWGQPRAFSSHRKANGRKGSA